MKIDIRHEPRDKGGVFQIQIELSAEEVHLMAAVAFRALRNAASKGEVVSLVLEGEGEEATVVRIGG
jgi:hypothetical protein